MRAIAKLDMNWMCMCAVGRRRGVYSLRNPFQGSPAAAPNRLANQTLMELPCDIIWAHNLWLLISMIF